jgi:hypothetical protein
MKISRIFTEHSQIPAVVSPTRSGKRQHELRAPMNSVGRLVRKRMSLLFLFAYLWLVQPPLTFFYFPLLNLCLYSPRLVVFVPLRMISRQCQFSNAFNSK